MPAQSPGRSSASDGSGDGSSHLLPFKRRCVLLSPKPASKMAVLGLWQHLRQPGEAGRLQAGTVPGAPSRPGVRFGPCKHLPSRGAHLPGRGAALGYLLTRSRVRSPVTPLVSPSLPLLTLPPPARVCLHGVTPLSSCWRRRSAPPHPSESRHLCSPAPRFPARRLLVHLHSRLGGRRGLPRFSGGPGDILAGGVRTHGRREAPTQTETQSEAGDASEALPGAGMEAPGEEGGPCHRGAPGRPGMGRSLARAHARPWWWLQGAGAAGASVARGGLGPQGCATEATPIPVRSGAQLRPRTGREVRGLSLRKNAPMICEG